MPEKRSVLVVDDDPGFLDLIKQVLVPLGIDVVCTENPFEASKLMQRKRFQVAVIDYQLPEINGDRLIANLQEYNPQVRCIVLSGMGGDEIEAHFKGSGYYAYFEKGRIDISALRKTVLAAFLP